jgi:hypothetical protein
MTTTNFQTGTVIESTWLNDVDADVYGQVPRQLAIYTVSTLPTAATAAKLIYVSNETGGAVVAFSDGTNWRRVTDRAIVS